MAVELNYKIVVIGDPMVGKSNLTAVFTGGEFTTDTNRTFGVDYVDTTLEINSREVKLEIFDSAGQERYGPLVKSTYNGSHGALVVFDLTQRATFEHVTKWLSDFRERAGHNPVVILVGNKSDLSDRAVAAAEADAFARENGTGYFETSAKDGQNVQEVFKFLAQQIFNAVGDHTWKRERHGPQGPTVPVVLAPVDRKKDTGSKCKC